MRYGFYMVLSVHYCPYYKLLDPYSIENATILECILYQTIFLAPRITSNRIRRNAVFRILVLEVHNVIQYSVIYSQACNVQQDIIFPITV